MAKVSIVGVGRVGGALTQHFITNPDIDDIVLCDIVEEKVDGTILDISHAYPQYSHKLIKGGYSDVSGSDVVVITAGVPRTSVVKTRMDLLEKNAGIIRDIIDNIDFSEHSVVILTTNPVEPLTYLICENTGLPRDQIIGFSNILDSNRLRFSLSKNTGVVADNIYGMVIGQHGENMIPLFSQCTIDGNPLTEFDVVLDDVRNDVISGSKKIIAGLGGTQYGPAAHLADLVNAVINDSGKIFPVSFYVDKNDFYGVDGVCVSLPVKIGRNGVSEVVDLDIDEDERDKLDVLCEKLKGIQHDVHSGFGRK